MTLQHALRVAFSTFINGKAVDSHVFEKTVWSTVTDGCTSVDELEVGVRVAIALRREE